MFAAFSATIFTNVSCKSVNFAESNVSTFLFWKQGGLNYYSLSTDAVQSELAFGLLQHFTAHAALKC